MIYEHERLDELHRNGYKLIQDPNRFCFGIDAVLLSDFATANEGEDVLDMGCGNGAVTILLEAKTKAAHLYGLEIQKENCDLARRSVALNELSDKIDICCGDICEAKEIFSGKRFDVIVTNPPYMAKGCGIVNPKDAKAIARHEILCSLEDVISQAGCLLREKGRFYMIHRPYRIASIISLMREYEIEPKRMRLVYPYEKSEANLVLMEGSKGGGEEMKVMPPLVVYNEDGTYSKEIHEIYGEDWPG